MYCVFWNTYLYGQDNWDDDDSDAEPKVVAKVEPAKKSTKQRIMEKQAKKDAELQVSLFGGSVFIRLAYHRYRVCKRSASKIKLDVFEGQIK